MTPDKAMLPATKHFAKHGLNIAPHTTSQSCDHYPNLNFRLILLGYFAKPAARNTEKPQLGKMISPRMPTMQMAKKPSVNQ